MSSAPEHDLPTFVREAMDERDDEVREVQRALGLHELLSPASVGSSADRLMASVEELPLRYAPFYSRIAQLWDLDEERVVGVLTAARDESAWRKPGLPGLRVVDVEGGPRTAGADVHLVRFAKGMTFPAHRHPGPEALLVLEGSYTDSSGRFVGPGDLHEMEPGSQHSFRVGKDEPCIAASVQAGREFTGTLMRLLVKFFG